MMAAEGGHSDVVKLLLSYRADPTIMDNDGKTANQLAVLAGHDDNNVQD